MKFVLTSTHRYWWPVKVSIPDPDPSRAGEYLEMEFKMQFDSLPRDEADKVAELMRASSDNTYADLKRVSRDWDENVVDENGKPIPFSAEAFEELLRISWYRLAVYRAWGASLVDEKARLGN
tara:strand:- start:5883 stop:6248 length:366 start_codon:yes stop_codon:yes gene_type:complete